MSLQAKPSLASGRSIITFISLVFCFDAYASHTLEEVVVTAQKREESLQDTPVAVSVLNDTALNTLGIDSLDGLINGAIPSLRVNANPNSPSTLSLAIRGDGASDVVQPTRQSAVAVYMDGIYLGRTQGLNMEIAHLQRIEVLRGPQGTLFGQNSTSGAVNLISHRPTGELGLSQKLGTGNYGALRSVTRLNLPATAGLSVKINAMHSQRDGWVNNRMPGQADYTEYHKDGHQLIANWQPHSAASINYTYDQSQLKTAQLYFQLYKGTIGRITPEKNRQHITRFPLLLQPNRADIKGHCVTGSFTLSDTLTLTSLTAYRELKEDGFNNYGDMLNASGLILDEDTAQEQYSQELQLTGSQDRTEWVAGIYYFQEDTHFDVQFLTSLDANKHPTVPPVQIFSSTAFADAQSSAIYGQATFTIDKHTDLTAGARFTQDKKSATRNGIDSRDIDSSHTDALFALHYAWFDHLTTYIKWTTAYKAGGYNIRSASFLPYDKEVNKTYELGLKSEWFNRTLRLNTALFNSTISDKQFDFTDTANIFVVEPLNAIKKVKISGLEIELSALIAENLIVAFNYTYLDGDMPLQPHPHDSSATQLFELIQTPQHAAALTIDYELPALPIGSLSAHLDISSTDGFAHTSIPAPNQDAYTLTNASLTLSQMTPGQHQGKLSFSLWGKNLTDEEYASLRFPLGETTIQAFGTPRTYGIDIIYTY